MIPDRMRRWRWLLTSTFQKFSADNGNVLSAAMAYYASFSVFPLCLIALAGFGYVARFSPHVRGQQQELLGVIERNAGGWMAEQIGGILQQVEDKAQLGGPLGLAALIFTAVGVFTQLEWIFDRVWNVPHENQSGILANVRRVLVGRLTGLLMLLALGGAVVAVFILNIVLSSLRPYAVELPAGRYAWKVAQVLVTIGLNALILAAMYRALPRAPVRWKEALAGGLFAALLWQVGQQVLEVFVIGNKYSAYGVIGSFIAVMLWMYYASAVLFLGAEFVQAVQEQKSPAAVTAQSGM